MDKAIKKLLEKDEMFMIMVGKAFNAWFEKNLIWCEDTHSFVHRLCKKLNYQNNTQAQTFALDVINEMKIEFKEKFMDKFINAVREVGCKGEE